MITDVSFHDGTMQRIALPGNTLAYGHADTISKGWPFFGVSGSYKVRQQMMLSGFACLCAT